MEKRNPIPHNQAQTDPYDEEFDLSGFDRLVDLVWRALQEHRLENHANWYQHFVDGCEGLRARLHGVRVHYREIHAWKPYPRDTEEMDYHLATILFGMDSAVECCTYALNALGYGVSNSPGYTMPPGGFHDVSNDAALGRISPQNVIGKPAKGENKAVPPRPGYAALFPEIQRYWQHTRALLEQIMAQHDVSKHRMATLLDAWTRRTDPPEGFFESLGITDEQEQQLYIPPANFCLLTGVKEPNTRAKTGQGAMVFTLEEVVKQFRPFIQKTGELAYQDSANHIVLPSSYSILQSEPPD